MTDPVFALSLAVIVSLVYMVVLRLIDVNEKEPFWALAMVQFAGFIGAGLAFLLVPPFFRTFDLVGVAVTAEVAKFLALAAAIAALEGIGRLRGWSEINGVVDGVVYGAAVGLGFAVGEAFARELTVGASPFDAGPLTAVWTTALVGLSEAVPSAVLGAGLGAALAAGGRSSARCCRRPGFSAPSSSTWATRRSPRAARSPGRRASSARGSRCCCRSRWSSW